MRGTQGSWSPAAVQPFLGRHCQVVLACHACGGVHRRAGRLTAGRRLGELRLADHVCRLEEVQTITAEAQPRGDALPPAWALAALGLLASASSWLRWTHH
jgi:hypothetical protein